MLITYVIWEMTKKWRITQAHTKVPVTISVMATPTFAGASGLPVMLIKPCVPAMTTSYLEKTGRQQLEYHNMENSNKKWHSAPR